MKNKRMLIRIQDAVIGIFILISIFILLDSTGAYADSSVVDEVTITVPVSCSITGTVGTTHTASVDVGTYEDEIGETTFNVLCNDANGFSVYAIGYSDNTYGNTTMVPSNLTITNSIATGTATSGGTSNWAMKLTAVSGTYAPTLATGFNAYHAVPEEYTKVASLDSNTDAVSGSSFKSTYAVYISQAQAADTYTGKVKYTIVHPADATTPVAPLAMQNLSSASCTSTPSQVVDSRDGREYTIQRLLDGNCWMMENLDLGRTDLTTDLTSSNTNIATTVPAATFNGWKITTPVITYETGEIMLLDGEDSVSGNSYGTAYNFYAASGGTISGSVNSNDAAYDICPAGWRLPTGGSTGEFNALYSNSAYNTAAKIHASIEDGGAAFTLSGRFYDSGATGQGTLGYYWSSTRKSDTAMSSIRFATSYFFANDSVGRNNGYTIRCILKEPMTISKLTYLQDFNNLSADDKTTVLASMEDSTTYNLIDNRDNKTYKIAKMKDGKVWMAENLDLGRTTLSINLTSSNTNLSNTITAATFNSWKKTSGTDTLDEGEFIPLTTSNTSNGLDTDPVSGAPYGTLYNYYVASAGTVSGDDWDKEAPYDICPAGWRLPTSGSSGDYQTLYNEYNSYALMRAPITENGAAFVIAGYFYDSSPTGQGSHSGSYWSSTRGNTDMSMRMMSIETSSVWPTISTGRGRGSSVRCIAK